jgi:pimeloyl-ACP methyl ester carboxylesterase
MSEAQNPGESIRFEPSVNEKRNFGHGEVQMIRVTPNPAERSAEATDLPLLFAHGHGQDRNLLQQLRAFAATGEDAFGAAFVGPRRSIKWLPRRTEMGFKAPQYQVDKSEDMVASMDAMHVDEANIVATSEGALRTMIAVGEHPEKFRNIVLVHPAGMDDKGGARTHARVVYHYGRDVLTNPGKYLRALRSRKSDQQDAVAVSVPRLKKFLTRRAEQETVAFSRFHELAAQLQAEHPHLRFLIIADKDDRIYPPQRLQQVNPTIPVVVSDWGGHGIRDQRSVREIVGHLRGMEQGRKKPSQG